MGPLALPYIILPGAAAVAAAWAISDWRIAGAAAAGALGLLFLLPGRVPPGGFLFPVIAGIAVAGLVLLPLLLLWPATSIWSRMTLCLAAAVACGFGLILSNPGVV